MSYSVWLRDFRVFILHPVNIVNKQEKKSNVSDNVSNVESC